MARRIPFWDQVDKSGDCWIFSGTPSASYPRVHRDGKQIQASHAAWEMHFGPVPPGTWVLHHCDVPRCVRPDHLFLGTPKDNTRDAVGKNRMASGERHGMARLTVEQVQEIRRRYADGGTSQQALADEYNVSRGLVGMIAQHKRWRTRT